MSRMDSWLIKPQKRLGAVGLLVLMVLGSLAAPFSLDTYTPAVPGMVDYFNTTADIVNLTLVGYTLVMAFALLLFGPLSDRFGRKPVMAAGFGAYMLSSVACALSINIWMLVVARLVQALGSGAMAAVATAIVKDAIQERYRERMLAIMQIMFVVGPVAAPLVGGGILIFFDWRAIFVFLVLMSAAGLVMTMLYEETLPPEQRLDTGIIATLGRLVHVGKNRAFMLFLFATSAFEFGYMGYVSVASYIYIDMFGFPPIAYGLFFAASSLMCAVGPAAWLRLSKRISVKRFTTISVVAGIVIGAGMLAIGHASAYIMCLLFLVFVFFESAVRPYSFNVLLSQQDSDTGSASALINFSRAIVGVIGMFLVMLPFPNYVVAVGVMVAGGMALSLVSWMVLLRSRWILRGVKDGKSAESLL